MALRALPVRVGGWEMRADIALGQRAVERVGQRVQPDIGVGMPREAALMRHPHAAQPDMIARAEAVHVEAVACADLACGHGVLHQPLGAGRGPPHR